MEPVASCPGGEEGMDQGRVERGDPSAVCSPIVRQQHVGVSRPGGENASPGFLPPLIAAGKRSGMMSSAMIPCSSTPGSAAAQALQALMLNSAYGEKKWLMDEISLYNVPVKRRSFPKEAARLLREALDETLSVALSLHGSSPLAAWPSMRSPSLSSSRGFSSALYWTAAREASRPRHSRGGATC